jgi:hypothetical protein
MTQALKKRLFAVRSEAISRISPYRNLYACPTCMRLLPIEAIDTGELTLEHVPPESLCIALTCKDCNNTAGHTVDAAVLGRERYFSLGRALPGRPGEFEGPVQISIEGVTLNASMTMEGRNLRIEVHEGHNHPATFTEHLTRLNAKKPEGDPAVEIQMRARIKFGWHPALVGDMRAAFLASFAKFGYRYAFHPRLNVVREQILDPATELITGAWRIAGSELTDDPMLMVMTGSFPAVLVRLRSAMVALPWMNGPDDFYQAVRELFAGGTATISMDVLEWPTTLELLYDKAFGDLQSGSSEGG